ncbi:Beta-glucosidase 40, partial [Linum grandiflorum]
FFCFSIFLQYEGAVEADGRGATIWDTYSHTVGKILDFSNADVAVDQYHRFDDDIKLMKDIGLDAYRFSISWTRIFPNGSGHLNQGGVDHYNKFIDALLANGIEPYVTLYHWDLPQALYDRYTGWLDPQIVQDYVEYAETCFEKFGDRVKHWITFNEPHTFAVQGYDSGIAAPGRCSLRLWCKEGDSHTEPYIVAHHTILAHATAADIYRRKYKPAQKGILGVSFDVVWFEPGSSSPSDVDAAQRAQDFQLGWFLDPMMFGDYPSSMRSRVGNRLPKFSDSDVSLVKGSLDFVGINHYTTYYATNSSSGTLNDSLVDSSSIDSDTITSLCREKKILFDLQANSIWLYIVPEGMRSLMNYIRLRYGNPPVFVTENGMDDPNNPFIPIEDALKDDKRIKYLNDYLTNLLASIKEDGCNVKGYFVWSLMDNWEWAAGYTSRFGLYFVDYGNNLTRFPKNSVTWLRSFLANSG